MRRFEYKVVTSDERLDASDLDDYGDAGWELISFFRNSGVGYSYVYHFKREKP